MEALRLNSANSHRLVIESSELDRIIQKEEDQRFEIEVLRGELSRIRIVLNAKEKVIDQLQALLSEEDKNHHGAVAEPTKPLDAVECGEHEKPKTPLEDKVMTSTDEEKSTPVVKLSARTRKAMRKFKYSLDNIKRNGECKAIPEEVDEELRADVDSGTVCENSDETGTSSDRPSVTFICAKKDTETSNSECEAAGSLKKLNPPCLIAENVSIEKAVVAEMPKIAKKTNRRRPKFSKISSRGLISCVNSF